MRLTLQYPLDRAALARYLGYPSHQPPARDLPLLQQAEREILKTAAPRCVFARFALARTEEGLLLGGTEILLEGEDIARHLAGCHSAILFAATLGVGIDRLLLQAQVQDLARSVMLDAAASVAAEQTAEGAQRAAEAALCKEGEYHTGRFSPGYGDLPIGLQRQLIPLLDAPRQIGLTVTSSAILAPRKSVTALIGIADGPVRGRLAGCDHCLLREKCEWRKRGMHCGGA